jgi:hypothetical protein
MMSTWIMLQTATVHASLVLSHCGPPDREEHKSHAALCPVHAAASGIRAAFCWFLWTPLHVQYTQSGPYRHRLMAWYSKHQVQFPLVATCTALHPACCRRRCIWYTESSSRANGVLRSDAQATSQARIDSKAAAGCTYWHSPAPSRAVCTPGRVRPSNLLLGMNSNLDWRTLLGHLPHWRGWPELISRVHTAPISPAS